jgi:hypothetical protein
MFIADVFSDIYSCFLTLLASQLKVSLTSDSSKSFSQRISIMILLLISRCALCIVTYPEFVWLIRRFWIWWSNLLDLYTTGYNSSEIIIWHLAIFFRLETPRELFWLPTELRCTPLYSFNSDLKYDWLCPLITPRQGTRGKRRLVLSRRRFYWSVT